MTDHFLRHRQVCSVVDHLLVGQEAHLAAANVKVVRSTVPYDK